MMWEPETDYAFLMHTNTNTLYTPTNKYNLQALCLVLKHKPTHPDTYMSTVLEKQSVTKSYMRIPPKAKITL